MQWLIDIARGFGDDPESIRLAVVMLAGVAATVLAAGVVFIVLGAMDPIRRRLTHFHGTEALEGGRKVFSIDTLLGPVTQYVLPSEQLERNKTLARLSHAGFRAPNALQAYYAIKAVLAVVAPCAVLVTLQFFPELSTQKVVFYALVGAAVGVFGPNVALEKLVERRLKKLRHAFPDALDLLVVCVESGLGLNQALQRVADELVVSHPELAMELAVVNAEVRAGVDRVTALKNLAERTGLDDISGLVSLLVQTLRFGTDVADALRVYSEEFRDKRTQRAEEQAAKMGTKMIFPLVLFMFPAFFVVATGPAVLRLVAVFENL